MVGDIPEADYYPVNVISPDIDDGPWIAGGAVLSWYFGEEVLSGQDIDVFCKNKLQADAVVNQVLSCPDSSVITITDNATTLKLAKWTIQVIHLEFCETVEKTINRFDISLCQIATDGRKWAFGGTTISDIDDRIIRMPGDLQLKTAGARLIKYWIRGYMPCPGLVSRIQKDAPNSWSRHAIYNF
jgi:hypothetical protein